MYPLNLAFKVGRRVTQKRLAAAGATKKLGEESS